MRLMGDLPSGTVTFLFTDIESSTRLLQQVGDDYASVLAQHRRLLREAFGPDEDPGMVPRSRAAEARA